MSPSVFAGSQDNSDALKISERVQRTHISVIKEMMYVAEEEKKAGKDIISLGVGIPHYKMPEYIREDVVEQLQHKPDIDKYTFFAGIPALRQLIARQSSEKLGMQVSEDDILVTAGSMGGLLYTALTLLNPGDEVILISPFFPSYEQQILLAGGKVVEVPLLEPDDKDSSYCLDVEKIKAAVTPRTKAIILNSPQNPSGAIFAEAQLRELAEFLIGKQIYVITDEVYEYLVFEGDYFNIATIPELWPYVIRCCSYSKKYGMTGWRVGYVHTNPELIKHLLKVHDNNIVCAPHISQVAALRAISMDDPVTRAEHHQSLLENRNLICERLDRLPDLFTYVRPRGAYYIFPKFSLEMTSIEFCLKLLREAGVITVPGIGFGQAGEGHLRMSFGCSREEIVKAFDRIDAWWEGEKGK